MTTRLGKALDRVASVLLRDDARGVTDAFAEAARIVPQESARGLHEHYRSVCALSDAARQRGLVLAALPLMQAFEEAVAATGRFSRSDTDDLC